MHPMLNIAIKAARNAGRIVLRASDNIQNIQVHEKSPKNFVTNIDIEVEKLIVNIIQRAYSDHYFITEESGEFGNSDSDHTWIIDPIDGTNNFIHGLPHNCISIAMQFRGKTELAIIYNPHLDQLFMAEKGGGARLNNAKIRTGQRKELKRSLLSGGIKYSKNIFNTNYPEAVLQLQTKILGLRYSGSLALDMCYVACGYLDGIWTSRNAKIWDIAAGALIIQEAGGILCGFKGETNILDNGRFIGGNPRLVSQLTRFFAPYLN